MNVDSASKSSTTITKAPETSNTSSASSSSATKTNTENKTFKDELKTNTKTQDSEKAINQAQSDKTAIKNAEKQGETLQNNVSQGLVGQNLSGQVSKEQLNNKNSKDNKTEFSNPIDELSSQIETLSGIKGLSNISVNATTQKSSHNFETKLSEKSDSTINLKMDNNDVSFFLNLVQNQQMNAQAASNANLGANSATNNFTEIKSQATGQAVQVSAALLDALSQSAQSGNSIRIDFDKDIAVVMKLDKNGVISANFIPGDAAVENYLRNNIASLQQNFNDQNLAYNELSYSKHKENNQKEQQKNNKEQKDE